MKEYIVGMINGFLAFFIIGEFALHNYIISILLCLLMVSLIYFVFDTIPKIQAVKAIKKETKEIEDVMSGVKRINKEFRGEGK